MAGAAGQLFDGPVHSLEQYFASGPRTHIPKMPQSFQKYLYVSSIQLKLEDRNHIMNACDGELPPSLAFLALRYEGLVQAKRHFPKKLRKR